MANKDFRDWVNSPTENRNHYWEKWIKVNEDKRELVKNARDTVLKLKFKKDRLDEERLEGMLTSIISAQDSTSHQQNQVVKSIERFRFKWWFMAAASFTLLSTLLLFITQWDSSSSVLNDQMVRTIQNPEGRKSKVRLPDGSTVNLNSGSSLTFPSEFSDTLRWVELNGEAFFEVLEDSKKPFIVKTDGLETQVLGTTFNVEAYKDEEETGIALLTGRVIIKTLSPHGETAPQMLLPGEKFHYNKNSFSFKKTRFHAAGEIGWKDGVLVFHNTGFSDFVKILERWYGVSIHIKNRPSKEWNVNGHFKNESLAEVLLGVQFTHGIRYAIENKKVEISCE